MTKHNLNGEERWRGYGGEEKRLNRSTEDDEIEEVSRKSLRLESYQRRLESTQIVIIFSGTKLHKCWMYLS